MTIDDLTAREQRAINSFCQKGYVVQMSRLPVVRFKNKDTGEIEEHQLKDLVDEYDYDLKEERRAAAAERRLRKPKSKGTR